MFWIMDSVILAVVLCVLSALLTLWVLFPWQMLTCALVVAAMVGWKRACDRIEPEDYDA